MKPTEKQTFISEGKIVLEVISEGEIVLETHREAETHKWGGDCWVYMCEWSLTLNNDEKKCPCIFRHLKANSTFKNPTFFEPLNTLREVANGARQRWGARQRERHMETYGWCTSEGKGPLGKWEWAWLVYGPLRGLETHKEAETHKWGDDCSWSHKWGGDCSWSPQRSRNS